MRKDGVFHSYTHSPDSPSYGEVRRLFETSRIIEAMVGWKLSTATPHATCTLSWPYRELKRHVPDSCVQPPVRFMLASAG